MTKHLVGAAAAVVMTLAAISSAHAGRFPAPGEATTVIAPLSDIRYTDRYFGDELAVVHVSGDGDTVLRVEVFDDVGNLIDSDVGTSCTVTWTPIWTGKFTVVVTNLGFERNLYHLETNRPTRREGRDMQPAAPGECRRLSFHSGSICLLAGGSTGG